MCADDLAREQRTRARGIQRRALQHWVADRTSSPQRCLGVPRSRRSFGSRIAHPGHRDRRCYLRVAWGKASSLLD